MPALQLIIAAREQLFNSVLLVGVLVFHHDHASARVGRRHMSCSSWAPEDWTLAWLGFRLEHELVAVEREANDVMTVVLAVLAVLVIA
jgi:hypothetical protein